MQFHADCPVVRTYSMIHECHSYQSISLEGKLCHFDEICITGCTPSCHVFNFLLKWRHNERDGFSGASVVCSAVCLGADADQRKHQSSASLTFVRGIHRWPVDSLYKGPITRKMFPFDDVIMCWSQWQKFAIEWIILISKLRNFFITHQIEARSLTYHGLHSNFLITNSGLVVSQSNLSVRYRGKVNY